MFFRRRPPKSLSFEECLGALRERGFHTEPQGDGRVRVVRGCSAGVIEDVPGGVPRFLHAGRLAGGEIAVLVDGGYQKFWSKEGGCRLPALADHLSELHAFEEDLREALGLTSLYNTSLGTTNDRHDYDRCGTRIAEP